MASTTTSLPSKIVIAPIARAQMINAYTAAVAVLGLLLLVDAFRHVPADWLGLLLFAGIAAGAELMRVQLFTSSRFSSVSVSGVVAIAAILALGPHAGALTHLASGLMTAVTTTLGREKPGSERASLLRRSAFNIGMWVTASTVAGHLYVIAGGAVGNLTALSNVPPLVLAAGADVFVNLLMLITVIALQTGRSPLHILRQDFQWTIPIVVAGGVLGGGALALAYGLFGALGVAVFCLPILTTSYSLRLYTRNMSGYINRLEDMNARLDQANTGLLEMLGGLIDADDIYTAGHSRQVSVYAGALAAKMGLPKEERERIVKAALIHDIGKIGVPDSIIGKPGRLTEEEFEAIKLHPVIGAEIVGRMSALQDLVPLVRHHHERWDGRGYPDGISGADLPLGARILALADSLDAMCSDRPYRATPSFEEVRQEIQRCSGKQFDPAVVQAFNLLVQEKDRSYFSNSAVVVDDSLAGIGTERARVMSRYLKRSMAAPSGQQVACAKPRGAE
jgi:putative nucleotidyltransferase with HDIG domain